MSNETGRFHHVVYEQAVIAWRFAKSRKESCIDAVRKVYMFHFYYGWNTEDAKDLLELLNSHLDKLRFPQDKDLLPMDTTKTMYFVLYEMLEGGETPLVSDSIKHIKEYSGNTMLSSLKGC